MSALIAANSKPAILGGEPLQRQALPAYNTIGNEEKRAVAEVLDSGELSGFVAGPYDTFWGGRTVRGLEEDFRRAFDVPYAVAVNSATSGLHCALMALGVGPGDEVIVPPYTMSATATTVLFCGGIPVFADIEPETYCLDPQAVEAAITPHTRGIIAVNLFGHPAPLEALRRIADARGLFLIEDNAQAPGAQFRGRWTGTIGDAGIFSFNRHKTIQSGEGGVLVTSRKDVYDKAARFRNHGEVSFASTPTDEELFNSLGLNYRMTEMEAAVARCQLARLQTLNSQRVELANALTIALDGVPGVSPPKVANGCRHVYYFYVMRYDADETGLPRNVFVRAMQAEGFPVRGGYVEPLYMQPLYQRRLALGREGFPFNASRREGGMRYTAGMCPVAESLQSSKLLLTPMIYPPLTRSHMEKFAAAARRIVNFAREILQEQRS